MRVSGSHPGADKNVHQRHVGAGSFIVQASVAWQPARQTRRSMVELRVGLIGSEDHVVLDRILTVNVGDRILG